MKQLILLTGMHHSGISVVAEELHRAGLHNAGGPEGNAQAPRSNHAHGKLVSLNDAILRATGGRWDNPCYFLDDAGWAAALEWYGNDAAALLEQAFRSNDAIYLADPRISYLMPFWLDVVSRCGSDIAVRVLHVVRNPLHVCQSLAGQARRDPVGNVISRSMDACFALWANHNAQACFYGKKTPNLTPVRYEDIISEGRDIIATRCAAWDIPTATESGDISAERGRHNEQDPAETEADIARYHVHGYGLEVLEACFLHCMDEGSFHIVEDLMEKVRTAGSIAPVATSLLEMTQQATASAIQAEARIRKKPHDDRDWKDVLNITFLHIRELERQIEDAVDSKPPFCLVRLGDGEGEILGHDNNTPIQTILHYITNFFGTSNISIDQYFNLTDDISRAIQNSDVVGVPVDADKTFNYLECGYKTDPSWYRQDAGGTIRYMKVWDYVKNNPGDYAFTNCHVHWDLLFSGFLDRLLTKVPEVGMITCRAEVAQSIKLRFNIRNVNLVQIPGEAMYERVNPNGLHYPVLYSRILAAISRTKLTGQLWLVGAGPCSKVYCDCIKRAGGIALDIGSVFDYWAKLRTRGILDHYGVADTLRKVAPNKA